MLTKIINFAGGIWAIGDVHGDFHTESKLAKAIKNHIPENSLLVQVGDFALGFFDPEIEFDRIDYLNDLCKKKDCFLFVIRGNHQWPERHKQLEDVFSNVKFIQDYSYYKINNLDIGFVGGAISIDRKDREEGLDYWKDEIFELKLEKIQKCDILFTHSAPEWVGPNEKGGIKHYTDKDSSLWKECQKERKDHNKLIKLTKPKLHICGHFHISKYVLNNNIHHRILNINELIEVKIPQL